MAELRKITPRPALSDFRQQVTPGPNAFDVLSGMAQKAYEWLEPAAIEEMKRKGTAEGMAAAQGGGYTVTPSSKSSPVDPSSPEGIAGDTMAALGKGPERYRNAIASIESAGSGDYAAVGPTHAKMGRALGRYQIMEANIGPWSQEALGRTVSADEFMANPSIQDAIFDRKFGGYVQRFGEEGAAQAWFAGPGGVGKTDRKDVLGTDVGTYGAKFTRALGGAPSGPTVSTKDAPVMVRTKEGRVEPRLFSPMSGPILQAHNAAAGAAYISEKMVQGQTDLITMAGEFALNPQGFQQAAEAYIGQMIEDAPDMFRTDLQSELRSQAQKTFLGIVEDQQRDTRQRAANSSAALVERWAGDYTDAIAGGNVEEAAAAEAKLRSILKTRETLPGLAWTPEQSENIILGARDAAAKAIEDNQKAVTSGWKDTLKTMVDAVKNGLTPTGTDLLGMPEVQAALPDEWAEAMAMTGFHAALPSFMAAPKEARDATIADMESVPISEDFQIDIVKAGRDANKAVTDAFEKSPMDAAGAYLPEKPPALPADPTDPKFAKALAARVDYASRLVETGHAQHLSIFKKEEALAFGLAMSKDTPPETRLAAVGAIIAGAGPNAPRALAELKLDDPVLKMSGMLMASDVESVVPLEAMKGQALLDEGVVQAPSKAASSAAMSPDIVSALSFAPESVQGDVMAMAAALYAARARGVTDEEQQAKIMKKAVQDALGRGMNSLDEITGGVQEVGGYPVLLPVGMTADAAETAMLKAMGTDVFGVSRFAEAERAAMMAERWAKAGPYGQPGSVPMMGGEPVDPRLFSNGNIRITPVKGSIYRMDYISGDGILQQVRDDKGKAFIFDLQALSEATK